MRASKLTRTIPDSEYTDPIIAAISAAFVITVVSVIWIVTTSFKVLGWIIRKIMEKIKK